MDADEREFIRVFIFQPSCTPPTVMEMHELARALVALGCPAEKSAEMASQLDKRAKQLAAQKGRTYDEAMAHLLQLMQQGWAAREPGL